MVFKAASPDIQPWGRICEDLMQSRKERLEARSPLERVHLLVHGAGQIGPLPVGPGVRPLQGFVRSRGQLEFTEK